MLNKLKSNSKKRKNDNKATHRKISVGQGFLSDK